MRILRAQNWLAAVLALWSLVACASLPTVDADRTKAQAAPAPVVKTANGTLPADKAKALLAKRWSKSTLDLKAQAALEDAATGVPLIAGNQVKLLFDGPATMAEMMKAIAGAKNNINFETYIFDQDELGDKFADLLMEKQRQGVTVNIIYDSVGTLTVPQQFFDRMKAAGIHLVAFNPVNPAKVRGNGWKVNNRDHRKMLIVDGKIGFAGGINISDTYSKSSPFRSKSRPKSEKDVGWRDTHVRIEGPAVQAMQWLFIQNWTGQDADDLREADYFPTPVIAGDKLVRILGSEPGGKFEIYKAMLLAIQEAKKSIHITCAYFVPDEQTLQALIDAAKRGVKVELVLPSVSDSGVVFHAGRAFYQRLLEAGVRIHELNLAVLHAKTVVIDGVWSTVGSTNMDTRSFLHNSEVNVIVLGDAFGKEMENAFREDLRNSKEVTLASWKDRGVVTRMKEWAAKWWDYWL
ncbi:cardiolipin synthase [Pseudoduganella armeniaca]|uniref:Cardiolipin synthase n=1 Tax=Pseudoduganella armeniaca TaxID=2072590 RepID=A0A2R4C983_9BURK|nr:cardiolipin synthase [Pseudoduganella armeniaca]AVR96163.1 cardiolipin synthase [Pseudoduganella armeniaca]